MECLAYVYFTEKKVKKRTLCSPWLFLGCGFLSVLQLVFLIDRLLCLIQKYKLFSFNPKETNY